MTEDIINKNYYFDYDDENENDRYEMVYHHIRHDIPMFDSNDFNVLEKEINEVEEVYFQTQKNYNFQQRYKCNIALINTLANRSNKEVNDNFIHTFTEFLNNICSSKNIHEDMCSKSFSIDIMYNYHSKTNNKIYKFFDDMVKCIFIIKFDEYTQQAYIKYYEDNYIGDYLSMLTETCIFSGGDIDIFPNMIKHLLDYMNTTFYNTKVALRTE